MSEPSFQITTKLDDQTKKKYLVDWCRIQKSKLNNFRSFLYTVFPKRVIIQVSAYMQDLLDMKNVFWRELYYPRTIFAESIRS